jgi:hypothetical protein
MRVDSIEQLFNVEVMRIPWREVELGLLSLKEGRGQMLFTTNLSDYTMPVPENYKEFERIELYFLLPEYWNSDMNDPLFQWAMDTLVSIKAYLTQGRWAINGHTFSLKDVPESRFKATGFEALLLTEPISLVALNQAIDSANGPLYFKALTPIFKREKDFKVARGIQKLMGKFLDKGVNEKWDEFRISAVKSRILFWR